MNDIKQAYRTLGLESDASFKEVMEAHRDLAVVWDPRPHENNPRLHRKATENLARVNKAFQLIRGQHLGTQIEPEEDVEEPIEQAGADSDERESSLYDEIFSDREAEAKRRMPIGKIVLAVLALMIVLTYWSGSREEDQTSNAAQQTPQGTEDLLEVEIKDGSVEVPSREPTAAEPIPEISPPASSSSEPLIVKKSTASPVPKSPPPPDAPRRKAPVVEQSTPEPGNKPILQRTTPASNPEAESPASGEIQEEKRSQEAFEMLKDKSVVAQKLIEGELQDDFNYQEWKMVRAREPEFWIDLIAQRSSDQGELHLIWSVNAETGVVTPMSQAARDLDAELSTQR
jgi:hypothetical protein